MAKKSKSEPLFVNHLLEALKLLSLCQKASGAEMQMHCRLSNYTAVAFDGVLAIGQQIEEDLAATPHTLRLASALVECGQHYALTIDQNHLVARAGDFQAFIPCCADDKLPLAGPDAMAAPLNQQFLDALKVVASLASDKAEFVYQAAIHIQAGSVLATDGSAILEAWHGLSLPTILIPKAAATALLKCKREITGFGLGEKTATFWLGSNAWIRTQLYRDKVPDVRRILDTPAEYRELSKDFFDAIDKVAPFSETGRVYCYPDRVDSHAEQSNAIAKFTCPTLNGLHDRTYEVKRLKLAQKYGKQFCETATDTGTLFIGEGVRGAIGHGIIGAKREYPAKKKITQEECIASGGSPGCGIDGCTACDGIPF